MIVRGERGARRRGSLQRNLRRMLLLVGLFINAFSARALEVGTVGTGERTIDLGHVTVERFAKAIGNNPDALFAFVRDEILYEPYVGCLRGARGTLMARAGNSLDRALLVSELFKASGYRTQLVRGILPKEKGDALAQDFFSSVSVPPGTQATSAQDHSAASTPTKKTVRTISDALSSPDHAVAAPVSIEDISRESTDHFWARYEKDGAWI